MDKKENDSKSEASHSKFLGNLPIHLIGLLPTPLWILYFHYRTGSGGFSESTIAEFGMIALLVVPAYVFIWAFFVSSILKLKSLPFNSIEYAFILLGINYGLLYAGCAVGVMD